MPLSVRNLSYLLLCFSLIVLSGCKIQGTIDASQKSIERGQSTTLTWSLGAFSGKAKIAVIEPGIGTVSTKGSMEVSPTETTTYTITWSKKRKSTSATVTVTVVEPPEVSLTADKPVINKGEATTLNWTSKNATSCTIDPEIGSVDMNGSISVTPSETTTYKITAKGQVSSTTEEVTVTVKELPTVSFSTDKTGILKGDSATLSWASENATSCTIEPGIGTVTLSGFLYVTPLTTTTYTVTAADGVNTDTKEVTITVTDPPVVNLTIDKTAILRGESATLSWTSENVLTCSISSGIGNVSQNGSFTITPSATTSYTITAIGPYSQTTAVVTITVHEKPVVTFSVDKSTIEKGDSAVLSWSSEHATSCSIEPATGNTGLTGTLPIIPLQTTTYTITASNAQTSVTKSITVTVVDPPTVTINASATTITKGESVTLTWSSDNTISCSIDTGIGTVNSNGSESVTPSETTTYTITAKGRFSSKTAAVTITVYERPTVTFSVDKSAIEKGSSATLSWNSEHATSCSIEPATGSTGLSGTLSVTPAVTTTYTITASNTHTSVTKSLTIIVVEPPAVTLSTSSDAITMGESATITWSSDNAQSCTIDNGIEIVDLNGSVSITPTETTTYTITAKGEFSAVTAEVTISVYELPTATFSADKLTILKGDSAVLTWATENTTVCTITPGMESVELNSSHTVTPEETTTYVLTASNDLNTVTKELTITVVAPPTVTFTVDNATLTQGDTAILSWMTENATSCTIDNGIGSVDLNGSVEVTPSEAITYTITVTGPLSSVTAEVAILVYNPPAVTFAVDNQTIQKGESATLTWTTSYANYVTIDNEIGEVGLNSFKIIAPSQTTTYTITAFQGEDSVTAQITITVIDLGGSPAVAFTADKTTIKKGDSVTLTWTGSNADSATIDNEIGAVELSGSVSVNPYATTTYTIIVSAGGEGNGGSASAQVTITVRDLPQIALTVSETEINQGDSVTLSWNVQYVNKVFINNGIGEVDSSGSLELTPDYTTTWYLTATSARSSITGTASVKVLGNPPAQLSDGSFGKKYQDLIPEDASLEAYDEKRFILITGLVNDIDGNPLQDVNVEVFKHPEYGSAVTDETGSFSIPAEGGGLVKLIYTKTDYITSHRKKETPWNDVVVINPVTLLVLDAGTELSFDGNPETILTHKSTTIEDPEFGSRACTLVLTGDNQAHKVDANGNILDDLLTITVRATEFTTPESMPSVLPSNSAFTYCVELGIDGAERVVFDKPVMMYVDNFLEFPVGEAVPLGYYDRDSGVWVAAENGVVVKLLDTDSDGIVDALDATGDDLPDDLNDDGQVSDEIAGLEDSATYQPGSTYWRVKVSHFTPWDCNWPYDYPDDADYPKINDPYLDQVLAEVGACKNPNSTVVDRSRILHQEIPIPGTDMALHYASNRAGGYNPQLTVPVSDNIVPGSCTGFNVQVNVGGMTYTNASTASPGHQISYSPCFTRFSGHNTTGKISARTSVGYSYKLEYVGANISTFGSSVRGALNSANIDRVSNNRGVSFVSPPSFGRSGGNVISSKRGRMDFNMWKQTDTPICIPGPADTVKKKGEFAEGWTFTNNHRLNPVDSNTLYKGDGTVCKTDSYRINTVAGNGINDNNSWQDIFTYTDDGGPAVDARLYSPDGIAVDSSGNLYIADRVNLHVRKVDSEGIINNVAGMVKECHFGNAEEEVCTDNDGELIDDVEVYGVMNAHEYPFTPYNRPSDVEIDSSGNIYISTNDRILKIDANGIIFTIADHLYYPTGLSLDSSGNIYFTEPYKHVVSMIDTNGFLFQIAGTRGKNGFSGDGGPATDALLKNPNDTAIDSYGNIYIVDRSNQRIRKIDTTGTITTFAGGGEGDNDFTGDGGLATNAKLSWPEAVAFDSKDNLYLASYGRVRKINTQGIILTIAGRKNSGFGGDGGFAVNSTFSMLTDIAIDAEDNIYVADSRNNRIRKISPLEHPRGKETSDITFYDENGLMYTMSPKGLHKNTKDIETGRTLMQFSYDGENIKNITDQFGKEIEINWDNGKPSELVSPHGLKTTFTVDDKNHLTRVTYEDGSFYGLEYSDDGFLEAVIDPENNRIDYTYKDGRVTSVSDNEGGKLDYDKQPGADRTVETIITSAASTVTRYIDRFSSNGKFESVITSPAGNETDYVRSQGGNSITKSSSPCGMGLEFQYLIDSKYNYKYVSKLTETTENNLSQITTREKKYDVQDIITEIITTNNKSTTFNHNLKTKTKSTTTPAARVFTSVYDPYTMLTTSLKVDGLNDVTYEYFPVGHIHGGKLRFIRSGTRSIEYTYFINGNLYQIKEPENKTTVFEAYDTLGRVTQVRNADGVTTFQYDKNGKMTVLTNPSGKSHTFGFNGVSVADAYTTPLTKNYTYEYDKDRRLTRILHPSGNEIIYDYFDAASNSYGKLMQIRTPEGNIDLSYSCGAKVESVTKNGETIQWAYNGPFVTSETITGTLNQTLAYGYVNDGDFLMDTFSYAGVADTYSYDDDGLLTNTGVYAIGRNNQNGLPESVTGGNLVQNRTFNGFAETDSTDYIVNGTTLGSWAVTGRNNNGRISEKTEIVGGVTTTYAYGYSENGRLTTVTKNGTLVEEYRYNGAPYGISDYRMNTQRGINGEILQYDDDDRLTNTGDTAYTYNEDGFLASKVRGPEQTLYTYSSRGELLTVTLPDTTLIDYVYDPFGRCTAKKTGGIIIEKYLWQGKTKLLAVYNGSDQLLIRFEYADGRLPAAMEKGGTKYYLMYNQAGSLRAVADTSGTVVKTIEYDSFGVILSDSDTSFTMPLGFAGGMHDRDTGLVRFSLRDYDPESGRWTSKTPTLISEGFTDFYGYALSDPVNVTAFTGIIDGVHTDNLNDTGTLLSSERRDKSFIINPGVSAWSKKIASVAAVNQDRTPCDKSRNMIAGLLLYNPVLNKIVNNLTDGSPGLNYNGQNYNGLSTGGGSDEGFDLDGDDMPDAWEIENGLDPMFNDGGGDLDDDGVLNIIEQRLGTEPDDPTSRPKPGSYYKYDKYGRILRITRVNWKN